MRYIPILVAAVVCAAAIHWSSTAYEALPHKTRSRLTTPPLADLAPASLKVLTLGHENIYNDIWVIWATQTFNDDAVEAKLGDMRRVVDSLLQQRPKSEMIYSFTCLVLLYRYQQPEDCERVILTGLRQFPKSWRLPVLQAFLFANKLSEPAKAASYYTLAASRPEAPPYMRALAERLQRREDVSAQELSESLDVLQSIDHDARFQQFVGELKKKKGEKP